MELRNTFLGGWVAGSAGNKANTAPLELELQLSLVKLILEIVTTNVGVEHGAFLSIIKVTS